MSASLMIMLVQLLWHLLLIGSYALVASNEEPMDCHRPSPHLSLKRREVNPEKAKEAADNADEPASSDKASSRKYYYEPYYYFPYRKHGMMPNSGPSLFINPVDAKDVRVRICFDLRFLTQRPESIIMLMMHMKCPLPGKEPVTVFDGMGDAVIGFGANECLANAYENHQPNPGSFFKSAGQNAEPKMQNMDVEREERREDNDCTIEPEKMPETSDDSSYSHDSGDVVILDLNKTNNDSTASSKIDEEEEDDDDESSDQGKVEDEDELWNKESETALIHRQQDNDDEDQSNISDSQMSTLKKQIIHYLSKQALSKLVLS